MSGYTWLFLYFIGNCVAFPIKQKSAPRGSHCVENKKQPVMIGCDGTAIYKKEESPVPGKATGEIMKNPRKTNGFRDVGSSLVCMILI